MWAASINQLLHFLPGKEESSAAHSDSLSNCASNSWPTGAADSETSREVRGCEAVAQKKKLKEEIPN